MDYKKSCKECGKEAKYVEGSKNGKPWQGWFCQDKDCKYVEWAKTRLDKPAEPVVRTTSIVVKNNNNKENVNWLEKDRRMYAQNALRHADEWIKGVFEMGIEDKEKEYWRFAEEAYKWIISK